VFAQDKERKKTSFAGEQYYWWFDCTDDKSFRVIKTDLFKGWLYEKRGKPPFDL